MFLTIFQTLFFIKKLFPEAKFSGKITNTIIFIKFFLVFSVNVYSWLREKESGINEDFSQTLRTADDS